MSVLHKSRLIDSTSEVGDDNSIRFDSDTNVAHIFCNLICQLVNRCSWSEIGARLRGGRHDQQRDPPCICRLREAPKRTERLRGRKKLQNFRSLIFD